MSVPAGARRRQQPGRAEVAGRCAAALLGGYAFCWGLIAGGIAGFHALGMRFDDAERLAGLLGLLAYPAVVLWAFAARSLWRVGAVLAGGGALTAALATLLQARLVAG